MHSVHTPLYRAASTVVIAFGLGACSDAAVSPLAPTPPAASRSDGDRARDRFDRSLFDHYVSIGTSVSMGWQSDGVLAASQQVSWPSQLAGLVHAPFTVPGIAFPGCGSPLYGKLIFGVRVSGEPAGASFAARSCAANVAGMTLPASNVAVNGALTVEALLSTPATPGFYQRLYADVLPPGLSQVGAMAAQHPSLVSVELGANEVLGARDGAFVPGETVVPVTSWLPVYRQVLDQVERTTHRAVLVGLIDRAMHFPSFRTGAEIWTARASFAPFNVAIDGNCENSPNVLFVPIVVPTAVATGKYSHDHGYGPYTLSCADAPLRDAAGNLNRDNILSPTDMARLDLQLNVMNGIIRLEAARRGFAYFQLGALYDDVVVKAPFDAVALMTSDEPYGPYISLDGIHPSAKGHEVLAQAALNALARRYDLEGRHAPLLVASQE